MTKVKSKFDPRRTTGGAVGLAVGGAVRVVVPTTAGSATARSKTKPASKPTIKSAEKTTSVKVTADALWKRYGALRNDPARLEERNGVRNELMLMYHALVRYTAERMRTRLPSEVDVDDLISAGVFGLMDAIDSFDPLRGIKFETYCPQRVRGAIFDELRHLDWVPRLVRSRTSRMDRVRKQIEMEKGRPATDEELQTHLDVSSEEFEKINRDSRPVGIVSLNKKWTDADSSGEAREIDVPSDAPNMDAFQMLQRQDLQVLLTRGLTRSERLIVILYYYEELTMKEIGVTLDLSESRVSQMHSSILARLKSQMKHRLKEVVEEQ
ncbi:MAG: FliA/WhiG family RNA polymerase sigma factor [Phycisphaerales bacterium]|nr:FliA/WhiG family RNA polymerase sigma factor [Phycisphaerales bacterium]